MNLFKLLESLFVYRMSEENQSKIPEDFFPEEKELTFPSIHFEMFVKEHYLTINDLISLGLAILPHYNPSLLLELFNLAWKNEKTQFHVGGFKAQNTIIPTIQTLLFLIGGNSIDERLKLYNYYLHKSSIFKQKIVYVSEAKFDESILNSKLLIDQEYLPYFMSGDFSSPVLNADFPAQKIETKLEWEHLILRERTMLQLNEIMVWLKHNHFILQNWGLENKLKPGFRVLFYGASGTGKTLTAALLGKYTKKEVYRIDLSLTVSKYIGETEKNLGKLFDRAADKDWILFFDEADSLFGKRTAVRDSHDKYANQEVSYLLQRIETHPGLVIIATNLKNNIDTAFNRRFHSHIEFELPGEKERLKLWNDYIPDTIEIDKDISIENIARTYSLSGANILNCVMYACLKMAEAGTNQLTMPILLDSIKREFSKEGKIYK